jgi:hypothetical protein
VGGLRSTTALLLVALALSVNTLAADSRDRRAGLIARAQVWTPGDIASKNLLLGPQGPGAFAPLELVTCDYLSKKLDGNSPKFACRIGPDDEVKVKIGSDNGEIYAEVAATRLLWALGFEADAMYPVRVICRNCPASLGGLARPDGTRLFDPATIERKREGKEITKPLEGWAWPELESVREDEGGAPRAQRDALKLLAAFLQHTDSKPQQQRLICLDQPRHHADETCAHPFMMVNDLGLTFGRANWLNRNVNGSMNLDAWSKKPVWKNPAACIADLSESYSGTLNNPAISEAGRRFLADLLAQLSDAQIHDMFAAARVELRPRVPDHGRSGFPTVDEWVAAFKAKRTQIVDHSCGQPATNSDRHRS